MHLWTEYEGRTVAGTYTLGKLLRSEGRNGFFATSDKTGHNAVIRLTESHYDDDELIERWRQVAGIQQDNLIGIERVGKTNFDGVPLTFALMEPNDADLSGVLTERPLTTAETLQVARAVSSALLALHNAGLVHEHIEPANVLAVGEVVKLRSDCVRECVADKEFNTPEGCAGLRRRDVHDFATLLLQCLTLDKELHAATQLPDPFYRIIPGALDDSLSLEQINAVLNPPVVAAPLLNVPSLNVPVPNVPAPLAGPATAEAAAAAAAQRPALPEARPVAARQEVPVAASAQPRLEATELPVHFRPRNERLASAEPAAQDLPLKKWGIYGGVALVVLFLLWHFLGSKPTPATPAPIVAAQPAATQPTTAAPVVAVAKPSPTVPAASAVAPGWYVIAYTYNRPEHAQAKVDALNRKHASLNPQVFNPRGHGPYYVALGGPMTQADATTILRRARRSGMPRDTFIRNF